MPSGHSDSDDVRRTGEPHDRLTELCAVMTDALDAALAPGEEPKCIVFLDDGDRGGIQLYGYEDDADAIVDLLVHLRAIFRANGQELQVHALGSG
jgi:hypothetical protein